MATAPGNLWCILITTIHYLSLCLPLFVSEVTNDCLWKWGSFVCHTASQGWWLNFRMSSTSIGNFIVWSMPGGICYMKCPSETYLQWKSCEMLFINYIYHIYSFGNFAQSTAVSLSYSVQNLKKMALLKNKLCATKILQYLSFGGCITWQKTLVIYDVFSSQLFIIYLCVCRYLSQRSPVIVYGNEGALSSSILGLSIF